MKLPDIGVIDEVAVNDAKIRVDSLLKPKGSLGRLEEIAWRIAGITGRSIPEVGRKRLMLFAADHGITHEGVSAYPSIVTQQMVRNFLNGHAAVNVLARLASVEVQVVDMGIGSEIVDARLHRYPIRRGTRNFVMEPAMTRDEMWNAVEHGIRFAKQAKSDGIQLTAAGEMGIGNTTSASAIYSALLSLDPEELTGTGTGITEEGRIHKAAVIRQALKRHNIDRANSWEILRTFGGYEIAAITGYYLGCAAKRVPVLVDGFICCAAAMVAINAVPACKEFMIFAHESAEKGFRTIMEANGISPLLHLNMKLGEGTGAILAMQLIDAAIQLYTSLPTFEEAEVSR